MKKLTQNEMTSYSGGRCEPVFAAVCILFVHGGGHCFDTWLLDLVCD